MVGAAHGAQPLDSLKEPINQILGVLKDPRYREPTQRDLQSAKIEEIINKIFDFEAISRGAVGKYWKKFTPQEKRQFTDAFGKLLSNTYIQQMQGEFQNEAVEYLGEEMKSAKKALVKTKIVRKNADIPVDYSLRPVGGSWKIYNVHVEGVSLLRNFRKQFSATLLNRPPAHLIERVQEKVALKNSGKE